MSLHIHQATPTGLGISGGLFFADRSEFMPNDPAPLRRINSEDKSVLSRCL